MKKRSQGLAFVLLAGLMIAACAPTPVSDTAALDAPLEQISPSGTPFQAGVAPISTPEPALAPTEMMEEVPLAAATSRGPDLESTIPSTVSLASGELQLVEFFRYT